MNTKLGMQKKAMSNEFMYAKRKGIERKTSHQNRENECLLLETEIRHTYLTLLIAILLYTH